MGESGKNPIFQPLGAPGALGGAHRPRHGAPSIGGTLGYPMAPTVGGCMQPFGPPYTTKKYFLGPLALVSVRRPQRRAPRGQSMETRSAGVAWAEAIRTLRVPGSRGSESGESQNEPQAPLLVVPFRQIL